MATYGKPASTHKLRNFCLKATFCSVALFGCYQFYTPNGWKDAIGQKVEHMTGSKQIGHLAGTLHPWEKTPVVQVNLPAPGK